MRSHPFLLRGGGMGRVTARRPVRQIKLATGERTRADTLAVEEPLEIRVDGEPLTVTMRTPGHDVELAHGLLRSEGVITSAHDVASARYCTGTVTEEDGYERNTYNVLDVRLRGAARPLPVSAQRALVMHGGCGLCGKTSVDAVSASLPEVGLRTALAPTLDPALVAGLPDLLREEQKIFRRTGGTHAAGLFDESGNVLAAREDIGRHNALDKVLGWSLLEQRPLHDVVVVVSSRASFELVQKVAMAGAAWLVAVSAPSSLAVEAADELGVTLVAFVRGRSLNVYTHDHRLASTS